MLTALPQPKKKRMASAILFFTIWVYGYTLNRNSTMSPSCMT